MVMCMFYDRIVANSIHSRRVTQWQIVVEKIASVLVFDSVCVTCGKFCAVSLRRHRTSFDEKEKQMMADVRRLREKLAHENRNKKPVPPYQLE